MRCIAYAVAMIVLGLVMSPAAFAHDDVVGTSPNNGDKVVQVPDEVRVEFAEPPAAGVGSVTGPAGQALRGGEAKVDGTELIIPVRPAAGLGTYEVEFRVTSTDGHPITGTLSFEVIQSTASSTPGAPSPEAASKVGGAVDAESPTPTDAGFPTWLWFGLTGGGVAVSALLVRAVSRARSAR